MAWIYLGIAGFLEVLWATTMKQSEGFTRLWPTISTAVAMAGSVWLLAIAMRTVALGTAYAIWAGIGAVGAFAVGIVLMGEAATLGLIASVALIITVMIGLKLSS